MGFLSFSYVDGVLSLKLDFFFFKPRPKKKTITGTGRLKGPKPAPPPFPLPPLRTATPAPFDVLISAPALKDAAVAGGHGYSLLEVLAGEAQVASEPTRAAPETTLLDDDLTYAPVKTNYAQQRRDVRKALRATLK